MSIDYQLLGTILLVGELAVILGFLISLGVSKTKVENWTVKKEATTHLEAKADLDAGVNIRALLAAAARDRLRSTLGRLAARLRRISAASAPRRARRAHPRAWLQPDLLRRRVLRSAGDRRVLGLPALVRLSTGHARGARPDARAVALVVLGRCAGEPSLLGDDVVQHGLDREVPLHAAVVGLH